MSFAKHFKAICKVVKKETKSYIAEVKVKLEVKQLEILKARAEKQGFDLVKQTKKGS